MSTNCKNDMCINIHVKRITSPTGEVRAEISIEPRTGKKIEKAWRKAGYTDELITELMGEAMGTLLSAFQRQGDAAGRSWDALFSPSPLKKPEGSLTLIES